MSVRISLKVTLRFDPHKSLLYLKWKGDLIVNFILAW